MLKAHGIVTLSNVIHSTFVHVDAVEEGTEEPTYLVRLSCMNDPEILDVTVCMTTRRALEIGLVMNGIDKHLPKPPGRAGRPVVATH